MSRSLQESSLLNTVDYRSLSVGVEPSNEYLIQTTVVGATPASNIEFTNLDDYHEVYRHLKVVAAVRVNESTASRGLQVRFNGDTNANYSNHGLYGTGSTPLSYSNSNANEIFFNRATGASATSGAFGVFVMDILDPFETTKYTTARLLGGIGGVRIDFDSGFWRNTAAITSMEFGPEGLATTFAQYSRFSLYGVTA